MTHDPVPHADRDHSEQPTRYAQGGMIEGHAFHVSVGCAWHTGPCPIVNAPTPSTATAGSDPTHDVPPSIDAEHLTRQREWSEQTFGPGMRLGVIDHIRKELLEVEADPTDLGEWVDVIILGLDGAWRAGHEPQAIIDAIKAKQARNEARTWPDWRGVPADQAIEHVRSEEDGQPQQGTSRPASARESGRATEAQVEAAHKVAWDLHDGGDRYRLSQNAARAVANAVVAAGGQAERRVCS